VGVRAGWWRTCARAPPRPGSAQDMGFLESAAGAVNPSAKMPPTPRGCRRGVPGEGSGGAGPEGMPAGAAAPGASPRGGAAGVICRSTGERGSSRGAGIPRSTEE